MNGLQKFLTRFKDLSRRRRIGVLNIEDRNGEWSVIISPAGVIAAFTAFVLLMFIIVLALVAYTPVTEFLPGYKSEAERSRENLIDNIMRVDSIERIMNDMMTYNENIAIVTSGRTPAVRTSIAADSVHRDKALVPPSAEDSILRAQMRGDGQYGLQSVTRPVVRENSDMSVPVDGLIVARMDVRNGLFGVRMANASAARVMAAADGTVMSRSWSPESGFAVALQHINGLVSVYKNLQEVLVSQGQTVRGSEVIGYTDEKTAAEGGKQFEFELWSNGKAVDPEGYIVF